jgi:hypothetical protein
MATVDGRDARPVCSDCALAELVTNGARCRCLHPSREFAEAVLFAGAPACEGFRPRRRLRKAAEHGVGIAALHGP